MSTNGKQDILRLNGIDTYYGEIHILENLDLHVEEGELVSLLGGNASGKSTTLKTILGLVHPRNGTVEFRGEDITGRTTSYRIRQGMAIVPENRRLFGPMTVLENLEMGAYLNRDGKGRKEDFERVHTLFPLLHERRNQLAGTLSGGEQQMVAMGRALMAHPKLLLMDEPSMGLAPILVERSFEIIQQVHESGVAMLIVEQNANMALSIADRGYVLSTGRCVLRAPPTSCSRTKTCERPTLAVEAATLAERCRHRFPIFEQQVYINSCSQGALSDSVRAAYAHYLADWDEKGAPWEYWVERQETARSAFAGLVNAGPDEIAVTTSLSAGVSALASGLRFTKRSKVVITDWEFPTIGQIWHAQEARGARVTHVSAADDGTIPLEHFERAIDDDTLIVALTHVCYRNGAMLDVPAVVELAHERGALVLLDAFQAIGSLPVDVAELGVDFLGAGVLKYLLGSAGLGFFYCRRDLVERVWPTQTGWFADENIFAMDHTDYSPARTAARFQSGTPPVPSIYAGIAGIELMQEIGIAEHASTCRASMRICSTAWTNSRRKSSLRACRNAEARSSVSSPLTRQHSSPRLARRASSPPSATTTSASRRTVTTRWRTWT